MFISVQIDLSGAFTGRLGGRCFGLWRRDGPFMLDFTRRHSQRSQVGLDFAWCQRTDARREWTSLANLAVDVEFGSAFGPRR